jgi:hypothetical protein
MTNVVTVNFNWVPIGHMPSASRSISVRVGAEHPVPARREQRLGLGQHAEASLWQSTSCIGVQGVFLFRPARRRGAEIVMWR